MKITSRKRKIERDNLSRCMSEIFGNHVIIEYIVDARRDLRDVVSRDSPEIDCVTNSWISLWLHTSFVYFKRGNTFTNHLTILDNSPRKKRRQSMNYVLLNIPDVTIIYLSYFIIFLISCIIGLYAYCMPKSACRSKLR